MAATAAFPTDPARSWWGWGRTEEALPDAECAALAALLPGLPSEPLPVPELGGLELPPPRVGPPASLADRISDEPLQRAAHTYGKAYRDVVRALHGDFTAAPDLVAFPPRRGRGGGPARLGGLPRGRRDPVRRRQLRRRRRRVPRR